MPSYLPQANFQLNITASLTMEDDPPTVLTCCYARGMLNVRLRFGEPQRVKHHGSVTFYHFAPGQRFGYLWWCAYPRRQVAGLAVAEALRVAQCGYRLPCVDRALHVHAFLSCRCIGNDRGIVGRADELIHSIEQSDIDPCLVPPVYYRLVSQALRVGHEPRRIDRDQLFSFMEEQSHAN